jgi:phage-related protein
MKDVLWVGSSKADWDAFPQSAKNEAGYQLDKVQRGLEPSDWKPMPTVAAGVRELRIRDATGAFRAKAFMCCMPFRKRLRKRVSTICALRRIDSKPSRDETL